jgi:GT2 family glycosyltransferase
MKDRIAVEGLKPLGFERITHVSKTSYQDSSMCVIVPSREPYLHTTFVQSLNSLAWPMNQRRAMFFVSGAEVGKAYDETLQQILAHPELGAWKYLLTIEDDTLPPADGVLRLIEAIEQGPYDGAGGLYFTKGEINMPMCYGDPGEFARTGVLDFRPRDVARAVQNGMLVECNGIAMGFSLYRTQSFRDIPGPWFVTQQEGSGCATQDLFWCAKARRAGKRFATDCRVRCAHADWKNAVFY